MLVRVTAALMALVVVWTSAAADGRGGSVHAAAGIAASAARSPLSVQQISLRNANGRIVGSARIDNPGDAPVRPSTGALGLSHGSDHAATGLLTFSVPSLAPRSSTRLGFATRQVRALPVAAGNHEVLICTDIYSQLRRFTLGTNCSPGARLGFTTRAVSRSTGTAPDTIISARPTGVSGGSNAVFRFTSRVVGTTFECSLDGGPWLACRSPRSYARLVNGPHAFDVRAVVLSGKRDPTPAHASWTVDAVRPTLTLRRPVTGSTTSNTRPTFSGSAGTRPGDSRMVVVKLFVGRRISGSAVLALRATVSGWNWSVTSTQPLRRGTYTAQAVQSDQAGNTGASAASTFTVVTRPSPPPLDSGRAITGDGGTSSSAGGTGGGTTTSGSTYWVGGTASGLSGTVVLQDNGGDDLSVSGNGAFTFHSRLADGAAYDVTVKTEPAGQICTVSHGAGIVASANVVSVAVNCAPLTDDFNRPDGGLGAGWAAMADGGLSIVSQQVVGTSGALAGDIRVAEGYGSDQFSQIEVTSTQLSGGEWIGPAVRSQNGGQDLYLGIYFWNNGDPQLRLYRRSAGVFTQLGSSYESGPLAAGTQLTVIAIGSRISLRENGVERIAVTDGTLTGGAPGIMTFGSAITDNWAGGAPSTFSVGGTVSGLSGTLVLQDNGGGDLNVNADGPFTFSASALDGATYNATVESNPSGQTCTIGGAVGTVSSGNVTSVRVSCAPAPPPLPGSQDQFNRPDGGLGAGWAAMADGGLSIVSQQVVGTSGALAGDIRVAEGYGSDQFSQIEVTSTQLSGGEWIGPAVRSQNGGQDLYLGIYFWNNGDPQLRLYRRSAGVFTQLGSSYESGPLAAGTQLTLSAAGSTIALQQDGITRLVVSDSTLAGGAPGLMTFGAAAAADNWAGGAPSTFSVGGTVSGLSGTLVLQDNGGGDLNVNTDGPFTFSAPLLDGTAYSVTVKSNPSGQVCTIAGAAGTVASANVTNVAVVCAASAPPPQGGQDNFNRPDGGLGAGWAAMADGGLSIITQQVVGTAGALAGDIRVAEGYGSDQFSQIQVTSTQLSGGEWIGPAVRSQNGGQDLYLGIYFWNNGNPQLRLYRRSAGVFTQLGSSFDSGPLPAGTKLTLSAVGSRISFQQDGVERIAVTDGTLTDGAPGIMTFDAATTDNWVGGNATASTPSPLSIQYTGTDANGVASYTFTSSDDGSGTHVLRVLAPTDPAPGVPHNFLYVLPVEPELGTTYGDGLDTLRSLNAQNQYNLTIIEPAFATDPWYADNPNDPSLHYETFLTQDLVPWVTQNLVPPAASQPFAPLAGQEQNWLIGFSKSGIGGEDLLLRHPDVFAVAASWDFPADMASYDAFGSSSASNYGTDANFQANYRLSRSFVDAHKAPFSTHNRIWIGGYNTFQTDMSDYDALLTSEGIEHTAGTPTLMAHRWDSGWVANALATMSQDAGGLAATQ